MYCTSCGSQNDANARFCKDCSRELRESTPTAGGHGPARPNLLGLSEAIPTYLTQAILVTIFCCWPLGIPAIVYAAQVNKKIVAGDIEGAWQSSRNAKKWVWIAFGTLPILLTNGASLRNG